MLIPMRIGVPPRAQVMADPPQHPLADRNDESRLFGQADEIAGRDQPSGRMVPPDQCLQRDDLLPVAVEDRLIMNHQLFALHRVMQTLLEQ
jgi:hypothetical protein